MLDLRPRVFRQSHTQEMYIGLSNAPRRVRVGPPNRLGDLVVMPDALHDLALQTRGRCEDAARDDVALDLGEPELDLIQPRRLRGREVQLHEAMLGEERPHRLRPVGRELVENDVDLALRGDCATRRRARGGCRAACIRSRGAPLGRATAGGAGRRGRAPESPSCRRDRTPRRAAAAPGNRPSTSAAFVSKSGSVDRMYRSIRWGCSPARFHARCTKV